MKSIFTKFFTLLITVLAANNYAQAQCNAGESEVIVTIVEDNYGSETSWTLTGTGGSPVYALGGPFADGNNGVVHTDTVCILQGTDVVFTIDDSFGDGICCAYGNGSYTVKMNGCNVVASGGSFADSETVNFTVVAQPDVDLSVNSLNIAPIIVMGSTPVTGSITNVGSSSVASFDLNYSIDNGSTITQTVNTSIAGCGNYNYNHTTPWNANAAGTYDVKVWVSNVSGDNNNLNDEITNEVTVATQSVPSLPLFEEFTSSTCAPCASFNATFDPFLESIGTNEVGGQVAAIKYQMDWPSPGDDPSFNSEGDARRGYYGVSGIPDLYLNGMPSGGSQGEVDDANAKPSFVNIALSYALNWNNEVDVTAVVTPYANLTGIKLFLVVTENFYIYTGGTTTQEEFHYVQRKMLPNASGNTLSNVTAGTPITVNQNYSFTLGNPAQGNYNIWGDNLNEITVVAFVQNVTTKEIYQTAIATNPASVGISEDASVIGLQVYPNPFTNNTNVYYNVESMQDVIVRVYNITGQEVYTNDFGLQTAGKHNFQINADNLATGMYVMNLTIGNKTISHKLSVTK